MGFFDFTRGGHFVLWDLGLVIEFPPGATILIPSALLRHSNVPIANHERRYSITQYTAGAVFRYIYNGFKSDRSWLPTATAAEREQVANDAAKRWEEGLGMFSTWPIVQ